MSTVTHCFCRQAGPCFCRQAGPCCCAQNYAPLPVAIESGLGAYLKDTAGKTYIDCMSAYSAANFGHCNPEIIAAATGQMQKLDITSRAFSNTLLCPFTEKLCEYMGYESGLVMNTGAEAVETAIKVARKWAYLKKGVPENKAEIIVAKNNFHGRTTTVISFSTEKQYKNHFGPLTPGFIEIPYNDVEALSLVITPNTAAFLVEPIQGEGGIIIPSPDYLTHCAQLCKKHNVLLLCDEIQTGLGRTGKRLATDHSNIKADGVMLGKSLGGGLYPVSAFLTSHEVMDVIQPGDHGSTFGGNPIACAIGLKVLELIQETRFLESAIERGTELLEGLRRLNLKGVKEIRGKGLMVGVEFDPDYLSAHDAAIKLMEQGLLTKDTKKTVLRLTPPLTITAEEVTRVIAIFNETLST